MTSASIPGPGSRFPSCRGADARGVSRARPSSATCRSGVGGCPLRGNVQHRHHRGPRHVPGPLRLHGGHARELDALEASADAPGSGPAPTALGLRAAPLPPATSLQWVRGHAMTRPGGSRGAHVEATNPVPSEILTTWGVVLDLAEDAAHSSSDALSLRRQGAAWFEARAALLLRSLPAPREPATRSRGAGSPSRPSRSTTSGRDRTPGA